LPSLIRRRRSTGALVGRTSFKGDILYSIFVSGLIYPVFGHWVWGPAVAGQHDGLVRRLVDNSSGVVFRDFAGSTVVHTVGGVIALAGCILGPRLGRKFKTAA
jgi:Amt family ammonium transporter